MVHLFFILHESQKSNDVFINDKKTVILPSSLPLMSNVPIDFCLSVFVGVIFSPRPSRSRGLGKSMITKGHTHRPTWGLRDGDVWSCRRKNNQHKCFQLTNVKFTEPSSPFLGIVG